MLLRCILMRHGQAASYHAEGDAARPLTLLGERQAIATASKIEALGWAVPHLASSVAERAMRTSAVVSETWSVAPSLDVVAALYLADLTHVSEYLKVLATERVERVMLVGHNPGWSRVASRWTGVQVGMDVACAALMSIDAATWEEACASDGGWALEHLLTPA